MMVPPYSSFHSQTRRVNSSRPSSAREMPWAARLFSTTAWVAMPAWSVPQIHSVSSPAMRRERIRTSWIVLLSAWPMCSAPVTLGGGMAIAYAGSSLEGSAWPTPASRQASIQRGSTSDGSNRPAEGFVDTGPSPGGGVMRTLRRPRRPARAPR